MTKLDGFDLHGGWRLLKRRAILTILASAGALVASKPVVQPHDDRRGGLFADPVLARDLGLRCLNSGLISHAEIAAFDRAMRGAKADLSRQAGDLTASCVRDFEQERLVSLDGWQLARTEALALAWYAHG